MIEHGIKTVLITGASGFLASHLISILESANVSIYGISDQAPDIETLGKLTDFRKIDIRDRVSLQQYIDEVRPDIVYHLAAVTNVGFSWQHAALTYEINLIGSTNLIETLAAMSSLCRIVLLSSAELYGFQPGALTENSPLNCRSPYALSKWAMEKLSGLFSHQKQLSFLTVRAFNFTGPGQSPKFVASDFARQIARIELGLAKAEIEVGNLSAVRDFSDVRDISRFLVELSLGKQFLSDTVNLCSGRAVSIQQILEQLLSFSDKDIMVRTDSVRFRPVDNPTLFGDVTRMHDIYGLRPRYSLEKTLKDLLDYWRSSEKQHQI